MSSRGDERAPAPSQAGAWLVLRDVRRAFRQGRSLIHAVDGVSLDIEAGETIAVTGPSGAGKSTLLHLIGGLDMPDSGRIVVSGVDVHSLSRTAAARYRRSVGFVFQYYRLLGHLSPVDNVLSPLLGDGRVRPADVQWAGELLDLVDLPTDGRVAAGDLSGGEQQRVAIARALVGRPKLVIADEPTGALDSRTGEDVLDLIAALQAQWGFTLIMATHDPSVAAQCARQIRLLDGRVLTETRVQSRDPDALLRRVTGLG
ncbi:antimicrobial peptide ABC transporter ATPase [Planotetraspora thailandica]|uniref:Antimicrobial peptide ABC transporter ATPase n=1 Tax=Planotetraspora thailandica TaxID=487172 RepID=A0A8J3V3B4_9ACTN|nr:ABC transporter ATP-binding protein [Planotetraspora thailandica]GII56949.1 antimicrobial peptide ABC transporter ATPase [Planotetraspora thailandica]